MKTLFTLLALTFPRSASACRPTLGPNCWTKEDPKVELLYQLLACDMQTGLGCGVKEEIKIDRILACIPVSCCGCLKPAPKSDLLSPLLA